MHAPTLCFRHGALLAASLLLLTPLNSAWSQAATYRGLWVGQVTLNYVNEVTTPLDANNVPRAPDPNVTTPTSDQANLRLILHVNGAGQTSLLKDVAILNRKTGNDYSGSGNVANVTTNSDVLTSSRDLLTAESDLSLVTDERLYPEFPPQPAIRYASAVFDFGDSRASEMVNKVIEEAANAAGASLFNNPANDLSTVARRQSATDAAFAAATNAAGPVVQNADVADAFAVFLGSTNINSSVVNTIAAAGNATDATNAAQPALVAATNLQAQSSYSDSRAMEMVHAVVAATVDALSQNANPTNAAQNAAASYADVTADYPRFIAGKLFGDMIAAAAASAAQAATNVSASGASIRSVVEADPAVNDARTEALRLKVPQYEDTRATTAIDVTLDAIIASATDSLTNTTRVQTEIQSTADTAGREALASQVPRYAVPADAPTLDFNEFVRTAGFRSSATVAAQAAAEGAVSEKRNNALYTLASLQGAAKQAAAQALQSVQSAAARAERTELPLVGTFAPGQGDPRLTWAIKENNEAPLSDEAGLQGTIYLPANHPTNPFRHRRHPDNQVGFDITRRLRLDFDPAPTNGLARAGYGVDRITGVYREEIFGLHKPLGPDPQTDPIGLKVEGTFELNRISFIDTLNAR